MNLSALYFSRSEVLKEESKLLIADDGKDCDTAGFWKGEGVV